MRWDTTVLASAKQAHLEFFIQNEVASLWDRVRRRVLLALYIPWRAEFEKLDREHAALKKRTRGRGRTKRALDAHLASLSQLRADCNDFMDARERRLL